MVLQGVAGLSGNSGKENQRGWSEAIIQERKRMRAIKGEGSIFTRQEKSKAKYEDNLTKNQCFKNTFLDFQREVLET